MFRMGGFNQEDLANWGDHSFARGGGKGQAEEETKVAEPISDKKVFGVTEGVGDAE